MTDGRRTAYERLRAERPGLFVNPPGCPIEIVFDAASQDLAAAAHGEVGVLYADEYLTLVKDAVRFPSGRIGAYIRTPATVDGEAAVVVAFAADGRVVLVRHFRHGCREWHWEFPRGFAEPGLDGARNAAREVAEELGVAARGLVPLGRLDEQESDRPVGVYRATVGVTGDGVTGDAAEEGITAVRLVTPGDLRSMVAGGQITDMYTLGAYAIAVAAGAL